MEESLKVALSSKKKGVCKTTNVKCIAKDGTIVHTVSYSKRWK